MEKIADFYIKKCLSKLSHTKQLKTRQNTISKGLPFDYTMLGTCILFSSSKTCFGLIVSCMFVYCSAFGLAESGERGRKSDASVGIVFFPALPEFFFIGW